jgi:hypothetical protein
MLQIMIVLTLAGMCLACSAGRPDVRQIRKGVLMQDLDITAFEYAWGLPDRVYVVDGSTIQVINHYTGDVSRRAGRLQVWDYQKKGVKLYFRGNELVDWKTDKTVEELKALSD